MAASALRRVEVADHLFTQAIELPADARAAFVRHEAGRHLSLCQEVLGMLRNYEQLSGFLEGPVLPSPPAEIELGTVLAGRFRVVRHLSSGGMGAVYAGEDLLLTDPVETGSPELVALKFVRPDLANLPWLLDQFRREIRLGRRVSHPRICRIHDVHEHESEGRRKLLFFSMQLLEGPSLAEQMLPLHPWPRSESRRVLRAIAEGLAAAHDAGIIHRDLKPGNVIMTSAGPVITDFGLAITAPREGVPHTSARAGILGSIPYMAPEQFTGQPVTRAADIFAFGVMAYQFSTGNLPFPASPLDAALEARMKLTYTMPPYWVRAIAHCLRPSPTDRPESVRAVMDTLDGQSRRALLTWSGGAGAVAVATAIGYRTTVKPAVNKGVPILLVDTAAGADADQADAVHRLLRSQIDQSAHFELLSAERIRLALTRMGRPEASLAQDRRTARHVALREGATLLVAPSVQRNGEPRLRVEMEKLGSHPYFALASWTREFPFTSSDSLMTSVTEAGDWVRRMTGERAEELAARARRPEEVTTASWEALLAYTKAEHARAAGNDHEAIRLLSSALALDPDFPSANMRLGDILMGQGQSHRAWMYSRKAADLVAQRQLTDRESLRIRGLFLHDSGYEGQAEAVFDQWASEFPSDYLPLFYLATCQNRLGRSQEALTTVEQALRRAPGNHHATLLRAQIRMQQGDFEWARRDLDLVRGISAWWWRYEAEYRFLNRDVAGAMACFDKLGDFGPEQRSLRFSLRACLFSECGAASRAAAELRHGIDFDGSDRRLLARRPGKWIALGAIAAASGDPEAAAEAAQRAADYREDLPSVLRAAMVLYSVDATRKANAIVVALPEIPDAPLYRALRLRVQGHRAMARREFRKAVIAFRAACGLDWAIAPADELAEALDASGEPNLAQPLWSSLASYPGRYWLEPERYWPGIHRRALMRMAPKDEHARQRLNALDRAAVTLV